MTVSKLLWGTGLENEVRIGYPLFDVVTDREERDGSEHIQGPSGIEDSWITGRDYTLDTEVRWIPDGPGTAPVQTALSGPVSWQEFLDWARDANAFRFVPDENVPDFFVDSVRLVEPRKGFGSLSTDIKRNVRLKLRNPTVDFHQALRGIMFEYAPGASLTDPVAATFTRASVATRRGVDRSVAVDIAGALRDRHYIGTTRTTLIERAATNAWSNPRAFDNAAWVKSNCTISPNASVGPDGLTTVDHWIETTDGAPTTHSLSQALPALADNTLQPTSFCLRAGNRAWVMIEARNKAGAFYDASFNITAGTIGSVTAGAFGHIAGPFKNSPASPGDAGSAFYVITMLWPTGTGGTAPAVSLYSATGDGNPAATYQGTGTTGFALYHGQFETDGVYETSLIDPSAARLVDDLSWAWGYKPQDMFILAEFQRPPWADVTGTLENFGLMEIAGSGGAVVSLLASRADARNSMIRITNADASTSTQTGGFPAGSALAFLANLRNVLTAPDAAIDVGSGLSAFVGGATALATFGTSPILRVGYAPTSGASGTHARLNGGLVRLKIGPRVFGGVTRDSVAKARSA